MFQLVIVSPLFVNFLNWREPYENVWLLQAALQSGTQTKTTELILRTCGIVCTIYAILPLLNKSRNASGSAKAACKSSSGFPNYFKLQILKRQKIPFLILMACILEVETTALKAELTEMHCLTMTKNRLFWDSGVGSRSDSFSQAGITDGTDGENCIFSAILFVFTKYIEYKAETVKNGPKFQRARCLVYYASKSKSD